MNLVINVRHKSVLFGPNIKWYNKIELSVSSRHFFLGNNFYWVLRIKAGNRTSYGAYHRESCNYNTLAILKEVPNPSPP